MTEVIARKGLNNVTVDSLVQDVTPKARGWLLYILYVIRSGCHQCVDGNSVSFIAAVPDYVKKELLQNIRDYLDKNP